MLSGSIFIVKATKDVNQTTKVEFTQLIDNSTQFGMVHLSKFKIERHIHNFTMESSKTDVQTIEFLDRNIKTDVKYE